MATKTQSSTRMSKISLKMALENKKEDNKQKRADQRAKLQMQELKNESMRISAEYECEIAEIRFSETLAECDKEKEIARINAEKEEKISEINAKVQIAEMEYRKCIAEIFGRCFNSSFEILEKEQTKRLQLFFEFFQKESEKFLMEYNNDISTNKELLEFYTQKAMTSKGKLKLIYINKMNEFKKDLRASQNQKNDYMRSYDKRMIEKLKSACEITRINTPNLLQLISESKKELLLLDAE